MLCRTFSATCIGLNVIPVIIETSLTIGVGIHLVGMPDIAVKESLLRVTTALQSHDFRIPGRKTVINMAPADLRKEGSGHDAAIAIGMLAASGQLPPSRPVGDFLIMGELALDGRMRSIRGALPIALESARRGFKACIFPKDSAQEASEVSGIDIYAADSLLQIIDILCGLPYTEGLKLTPEAASVHGEDGEEDFASILGQEFAKRGMEIAAAGNHNLLMTGPPGAGKSFMARCLSSILPPMTREESLQTSAIYSVAGRLSGRCGLMKRRPFRAPHHTLSHVALVGGGHNAMPGEISLAHNGVLYLDEMSQFPMSVLDLLRQPLEDRKISISRIRYKVEYPASFMLVGSSNPCPCGYYGEEDHRCTCTESQILRYRSRISGPLLDRIDITIRVKAVESAVLIDGQQGESSKEIAGRIAAARAVQHRRLAQEGLFTNAQMNNLQLQRHCRLGKEEKAFLNRVMDKFGISARGYTRLLKISRTIADLEGSEDISLKHISEAVQYRFIENS